MDVTIVIFGCVVWVPLMLWIVAIAHWMIGGDVEWPVGLLGILVGLILGYIAIRPPTPILSPIACGTVFITVGAWPFVQAISNRHQIKSIDVDMVERAYRALGNSPANQLAKFKLAEAIYKIGLTGHAVAIGENALQGLPERVANQEYRNLRKWKNAGVPPHTLAPITCVECQTPCEPGWTHCRNCGSQFLLNRARGRIMPTGFAQRLIAVWLSAVALLIGFPFAFSLPIASAVCLSILLILLASAAIYAAFRRGGEKLA